MPTILPQQTKAIMLSLCSLQKAITHNTDILLLVSFDYSLYMIWSFSFIKSVIVKNAENTPTIAMIKLKWSILSWIYAVVS